MCSLVSGLSIVIALSLGACSEDEPNSKIVEKPILRIAVASDFNETLKMIVNRFEYESGVEVIIVSGASGEHYSQIQNSSPYDILLSADVKVPELLESENLAVPGTRFSYAFGKLVLWSAQKRFEGKIGEALFEKGQVKKLSIASPKLASYGRASKEVLESWNVWSQLQDEIIETSNVKQAFEQIENENADLGFIALSQIEKLKMKSDGVQHLGTWWEIPSGFYNPIEQQGVLLKDTPNSRAFIKFMKSEYALDVIQLFGYRVVL